VIAVVNHSFEQQVLHGASALGRQIRTDSDGRAATIVGVVSDARSDNIHRAPGPFVYLPVIQAGSWNISSIEVRTAGDPKTVAVSIRSTIAGIDRAIPVAQIVTLSEETNRGLAREFLLGRLSAVFSVLTLLIAAIGLYGLFAYRVSQRRGELAIRMTLGATRSSLLQQVLVQAFRIWTVGCLAGLALSGIAGRLVRSLLFGIGPMDIWSHAASIALLFLVSIVAVSVPAWKAATVDPVSALKTN
jgi:ABC-type antimicrobial peptide transport system permease subunit